MIPFYVQVAETLKRRLLAGEYAEDSLIPSMEELEKEFQVSNITLRKAMALLADEGLLLRKRGLGTFVAKSSRDIFTMEISGSFARLIRLLEDASLEIEVLDTGYVPCPNSVAQVLGRRSASPIWRMRRIRKYQGSPLGYYSHYCSLPECDVITHEEVASNEFIQMLNRVSQREIAISEERLEATTADCDLMSTLKVSFGTPLLFIESMYSGRDDIPIALTNSYYRGDRCSFKVKVLRPQPPEGKEADTAIEAHG